MVIIKNLPTHERPREKMIEKGVSGLRNSELLAVLLRTGYAGKNVIEVAKGILRKFPMKKLLAMSYEDLIKVKGISSGKACSLLATFELTKRALEVEDNNLPVVNTARDAMNHLQELCTAKKEHLIALYLNAKNQLIHKETISIGTLDASLVHPREVFKPAIDYLAASIVLAHNHPSGDIEASEDDMLITRRIIETGGVVGINVSDCLIITKDNFQSYKNKYL
ncbi:MAG: DNA repair protein RadC [Bacteroidales bacterium]|nr:DNA repair protein RadC [Bacteroidales bacterium]